MKKIKFLLKKHRLIIIVILSIILFIILSCLFWKFYFPTTFEKVNNINKDFSAEQTELVLDVFDLKFNNNEYIKEGYLYHARESCFNYFIYNVSDDFKTQITNQYEFYYSQNTQYYNAIDDTSFTGDVYYNLRDNDELFCIFYTIGDKEVACIKYLGYDESLNKALTD